MRRTRCYLLRKLRLGKGEPDFDHENTIKILNDIFTAKKRSGRGERGAYARGGDPQKVLPIETPALSLDDLNKATHNFGTKSLVGEGSYGRVFYATISTGQAAVLKKLDPSSSNEPDSDFAAQVTLVTFMEKDIKKLKTSFNKKGLTLEFGFALITGRKGVQGAEPGPALSWSQRVKVAYGAARGLEYLHEKVQPPITHRDVRSSNVLVFDDFESKIADFNVTNQSPDTAARLNSTRALGTFGYHAPEYAMTGQLTRKSDVYSFGVATPRLSEDKIRQCVDPNLNNDYPPKAVAKMAAVAALCVQYEADFRPNMTIVVKALQPLLNSKPAGPNSHN
ncbi:hypothetical protein GIB67_015845 [Kingdonia uniflora]|uniref:Protein kinase domain-containing protein n=1 Tax=Kingdonia uniflora TaxID=39325 RepID=A0A7J7NEW6_9MAGN|nr:hypothetical protein GIB67_015845 [Kingdonia uniflora]